MKALSLPVRQRGVATLIVVALLFFIVSMVAAYTNRNLIFEQRTSGNQYRSTLAIEAAEAGVEWALSQLNSGHIDADCEPSAEVTETSFRQRYLSIDDTTGAITPAGALTAGNESLVWPSCVFDGDSWDCSCPVPGDAPTLVEPADDGTPHPAFRMRFVRVSTTQPGIVRLEVNGCTNLDNGCLDFPAAGVSGEGRSTIRVLLALRGGLAAMPAAALTVRGNLNVGSAELGAFNTDTAVGGITILAGGTITGSELRLSGPGGAPPDSTKVANDSGLQSLDADGSGPVRMFTTVFATWPDVWRDQPATLRVNCDAVTCDAATLRTLVATNPGRTLWFDGDLDLDSTGDVGSITEPLVVVVTGNITVADDVVFYGALYSRSATWTSSGGGDIIGAALAESDFGGDAEFNVSYDADVLRRLRWQTGSFVRVPGGWRDF
jgi:PilX N-terminal